MTQLQIIWFGLIGVLLTGYAILDGFDLGAGFWSLFSKKDEDRRLMLGSIGPVWDGNEVWLVAGGGALFAAFPRAYATIFSSLYIPLMLVLFALIFRAAAIEFRGQVESPRWRRFWDFAFAIGSIVPAFLFGVALGNILRGMPIDRNGDFAGAFLDLLSPYALLTGFLGLSIFATHGALYFSIKVEGPLAEQAAEWAGKAWNAYITLFIVTAAATFIVYKQLLVSYSAMPVLYLNPLAALVSVMAIQVLLKRGENKQAFVASALSIIFLMVSAGVALFPELVPSTENPEHSLTILNSSSSQKTLTTMLIIAGIGMPLVLGYTYFAYRTFRGKVSLENLEHY